MAWIELHQSLINHRKTYGVAAELGVSRVQVVGHLAFLWTWALENVPSDGLLFSECPQDVLYSILADVSNWHGDALKYVKALLDNGFIDYNDTEYYLHNWTEYAGKLLNRRQADSERKRTQRKAEKAVLPPKISAKKESDSPRDGVRTVPNRTQPYPTVTISPQAPNMGSEILNLDDENVIPDDEILELAIEYSTPDMPALPLPDKLDLKALPEEFQLFISAYPKFVNKRATYRAWYKIVVQLPVGERLTPQQLADAATRYGQEVTGREPQYIKASEIFLSSRNRWYESYLEDIIQPVMPSNGSRAVWGDELTAPSTATVAFVCKSGPGGIDEQQDNRGVDEDTSINRLFQEYDRIDEAPDGGE